MRILHLTVEIFCQQGSFSKNSSRPTKNNNIASTQNSSDTMKCLVWKEKYFETFFPWIELNQCFILSVTVACVWDVKSSHPLPSAHPTAESRWESLCVGEGVLGGLGGHQAEAYWQVSHQFNDCSNTSCHCTLHISAAVDTDLISTSSLGLGQKKWNIIFIWSALHPASA